MAEWTIYSKDGVAKASVKELELHDEWMAECFITVSVKSAEPIDFAVGDYIDYRDERYSINYDPSKIKRARRGTYGEGFVYDNIKFVAVQDELVRCDFCDIVLSDNQMHYTQLPTFPFYCETVDDLLDRIQANMEDLYPGSWIIISPDLKRDRQRGLCVGRERAFINAYNKYIGEGSEFTYEKTGVALTVDNINCWEALAKVHSDFGLNFIIRDRVVIVGTAGLFTSKTFKYGKGKGLSEIEEVGDSEQKVVTRLRAYGAETNMPLNYYAYLHQKPIIYGKRVSYTAQGLTSYHIATLIKYSDIRGSLINPSTKIAVRYGDVTAIGNANATIYDGSGLMPEPYGEQGDAQYLWISLWDGEEASEAIYNAIGTDEEVKIYVEEGVSKSKWPQKLMENSETFPSLLVCNRLMLPGFPDTSLDAWVRANRPELITEGYTFSTDPMRPFIDSPNKVKYGIRPSNIFFDGSDETEDIHPTIEGMVWTGIPSDEIVDAEQIDDNGVLPEDAKESDRRVEITIPQAGFALDNEWQEGATISMKDGMCGARDFKILKKPTQNNDGNWICVCERAYDDTLKLYFPYNDFQINAGDKFVLTGIELPDSYVEAASVRLFDAAMDALKANEQPRVTYRPKIDEIFMQRQHDEATEAGTRSLHDTLKAGDMFVFQDDDLKVNAAVSIDVLTIKENGNNGIPTYDVTLRDEKTVSTIKKIQDKVSSLFSGSINSSGSGGGMSMNQLSSLFENYGREYFVSRRYDDEAAGNITFNKNITVAGKTNTNEVVSSDYTGSGMLDTGYRLWYEDGRAKLVIDDITARGKFSVYELESRIMTHTGGDVVFSGAGSKLFYVEYLDGNDNPMGYTTINAPWMLGDKLLLSGVTGLAAWSNRKKIQKQLTQEQKDSVTKFRCYVFSDDGTMKTRNWWRCNDLARCQTFDHTQMKQTSEGYYSGDNVSNTVYWRRVAGIGSKAIDALGDGVIHDYFDLWNLDVVKGQTYIDLDGSVKEITDDTPGFDQTYHDWPAAGDDVVQFGNAVDVDRQAMVVIEVTSGEPGMKVYNGVYTYSLQNCKWVGIGYDKTIKRAYADVFGDFYFGERGAVNPRNGRHFLRFNSDTGLLEFKGRMSLASGYGDDDMTLDEYIKSITWTQEQIEQMIGENIEVVQKQLDGEFTIWYGNVTPTTSNYPAVDWTDEEKEDNLYDLYYDKVHKNGYRWTKTMNGEVAVYSWEQIGDSSILASLAAAADAQDTADGKRRVFTNDPNDADVTKRYPLPPYDKGDLWAQGVNGDILRCINGRLAIETYDASDWENASRYTDDSALHAFIENDYADDLAEIQTQVDGKAETWYQPTDPSVVWTTGELKAAHKGDIWHNSSNQMVGGIEAGLDGIWDGTSWVQSEVPQAVYDKVDGKAAIYVTWNAWVVNNVSNLNPKDLFIPASDTTQGGKTYKANKVYRCTNASTPAFEEISYTDNTEFYIFREAQIVTNGNLQSSINALDYLKNALQAKTEIEGGLMLTSLIALRNFNGGNPDDPRSYTTWAGINGTYQNGKTIAAWYGGGMIDHEVSPLSEGYAKSIFRMDGSGYVAGGNITWDEDGNLIVNGNSVATKQIIINGVDYTNFFSMFTLEGTGTEADPYVIKANYGLYSVDFISALGKKAGGGGGDISLNEPLSSINAAELGVPTIANVGIVWNGSSWVYGSTGGGADMETVWRYLAQSSTQQIDISHLKTALSGYATQTWVTDQGYITSAAINDMATKTWANGQFLKLSGGTMTGSITMKANQYSPNYGLNMNNSDIINVNTIKTSDLSDSWDEGFLFARPNGNWDSFRAANGDFYMNDNSGNDSACLHVSRLVLSSTNDAQGTAWNSPALCVGGSYSSAHIEMDSNEIMAKSNASTTTTLYLNAEGGNCVINESAGNCGIGTGSPSHKLHVNGGIYSTSYVTALSDERKKDVIEDVELSVEQVAEAPSKKFTWKDKHDEDIHIGSIAQYWKKVLPETVIEKDDVLSMDYSVISLASVIATAKKVVEQEKTIASLEKKIERLEKLITEKLGGDVWQ